MGIPKFYKTLREKVGKEYQLMKKYAPKQVSTLLLDANSIFHDVAAKVYMYEKGVVYDKKVLAIFKKHLRDNPDMVAQQHFEGIMREIIDIVRTLDRQVKMVYIAVDGVAPDAKISQQRQRRYKSAEDGGPTFFNTSVLTPGTNYMYKLDSYIENWLRDEKNSNKIAPVVLYSGHMVPGEGEHKIMDFLHGRTDIPIPEGNHVIYGMDGDLILLSMLAPHDNLFLYRNSYNNQEKKTEFFAVDELKNFLNAYMGNDSAYKDFCFIIAFIGNDFLPTLPAFNSSLIGEDVMLLLEIYKETFKKGGAIIDENGDVTFVNFAAYLQKVAKNEDKFYDMIAKAAKNDAKMREYNPLIADSLSSKGFNMDKYSEDYHKSALGVSSSASADDVKLFKLLVPDGFKITNESVTNMCYNYLNGLMWTYIYYTQGSDKIDKRYFYAYNHSPLLKDLASVVKNMLKEQIDLEDYLPRDDEDNKFVHPLHQLSTVIPHASKDILPLGLSKLMTKNSSIADNYPRGFLVKTDGVSGERDLFLSKPILPPIQIYRNIEAVDNLVKDIDLTKYEQQPIIYFTYKEYRPRGGRGGFRGGRGSGDRGGGFRGGDRGGFRGGDRGGFRGGDRGGFRGGDRGGFRGGDRGGRGSGDRGGFRGGRGGDRGGFRGRGGKSLDERKEQYRKTKIDF